MQNLIQQIASADAEQIEHIISAALERYRDLFPDWEIMLFSLERKGSREEQIDQFIRLLQKLKTEK